MILETIERGDNDNVSGPGPKTFVLRIHEAYGGHGDVGLLTSNSALRKPSLPTFPRTITTTNFDLRPPVGGAMPIPHLEWAKLLQ